MQIRSFVMQLYFNCMAKHYLLSTCTCTCIMTTIYLSHTHSKCFQSISLIHFQNFSIPRRQLQLDATDTTVNSAWDLWWSYMYIIKPRSMCEGCSSCFVCVCVQGLINTKGGHPGIPSPPSENCQVIYLLQSVKNFSFACGLRSHQKQPQRS